MKRIAGLLGALVAATTAIIVAIAPPVAAQAWPTRPMAWVA